MKSYLLSDDIKAAFEILENGDVRYVLLRNIDNELPFRFKQSKDIDILVHPNDCGVLKRVLKRHSWTLNRHPLNFGKNFIFLYSMTPFLWFTKGPLHLDVCFQLCCRSLNQGEWFPLCEAVQQSVWANRYRQDDKDLPVWRLCYEDELIHLITRSVFDKKQFTDGYIARIEEIMQHVDFSKLEAKIQRVFFKFTPKLFEILQRKDYQSIIPSYIQFSDY